MTGFKPEQSNQIPYTDDDVVHAILIVEKRMMEMDMSDPALILCYPTIRAALRELLVLRRLKREAKQK